MDRRWALREREAIGDASVGRTEGGERESGKRFWAPSTCTDTGRDGWGGKGRDPVEDFWMYINLASPCECQFFFFFLLSRVHSRRFVDPLSTSAFLSSPTPTPFSLYLYISQITIPSHSHYLSYKIQEYGRK